MNNHAMKIHVLIEYVYSELTKKWNLRNRCVRRAARARESWRARVGSALRGGSQSSWRRGSWTWILWSPDCWRVSEWSSSSSSSSLLGSRWLSASSLAGFYAIVRAVSDREACVRARPATTNRRKQTRATFLRKPRSHLTGENRR